MPSAMERSARPEPGPPLKRKIAAILAADVAGYSRLVSEDEERTLIALGAAREIFDGLVRRSGGRIFNTAGDSVMCEFDSAVEAVRVAIDIQDSLAASNAGIEPGRQIQFRIGITIGDVVERGGDLLGDGVNVAARLESISPPGGLCISRSVHEAVANKIPVVFDDIGPRMVKNLPQPIHAFLVSRSGTPLLATEPMARAEPWVEPRSRPTGRRKRPLAAVVALGILLAAGAAAVPTLPAMKRVFESWTGTAERAVKAPPADRSAATPAEVVTAEKPASASKPAAAKPFERAADIPGGEKPAAARATPVEDKLASPPKQVAPLPPAEAAAAFAALARDGVVPEAKTVPELYHNARFHETKGDRQAALAAYAALAPAARDFVDPLMRYGTLLRAASGGEAARRTFDTLARSSPSRPVSLIAAVQAESAQRRDRLETFAAANPDFAPADYFLAEALLERRQGGPTLSDRRLAFAALERFLEAGETGALASLFIDRAFLNGWLEAARARRGEIERFFASASARPTASFQRSDAGWTVQITLPEPATRAAVRIGETGEVTPASSPSGRAGTSAEFGLPASTGRTTLYVTYRDLSGREAGPFPVAFDPATALVSAGRDTLERFPDSWVSFRPDLPDILSYAQLVAHRCAIRQALIGYGDEPPREPLPLPACEAGGATPNPRSVITLPAGTDSIQIQLAYADGTESPVRTFRRP